MLRSSHFPLFSRGLFTPRNLTAVALSLAVVTACADGTTDDAGPVEPDADAGVDDGGTPALDAGPVLEPDPNPTDGGEPEDAGEPDPCANVDTNADLGTLQLAEGWQVLDGANFGNASTFTTAIWVRETDAEQTVMRLDGLGNILSADWFPLFPSSPGPLGNIFTDTGDDVAGQFVTNTVAQSGDYAIIGYTGFDPATGGFPGKLAIVDQTDFSVRHVNAPGNFSFVATADTIFVNSLGAGDLEGPGVYSIDIDTLTVTAVGTFPSDAFAGSGYSFRTADDVIGTGYANMDFDNVLTATDAATLLAANTPVDFSTLASVFNGGTLGIASHPDGFLHLNGAFDASFNAVYNSIDLIAVDAAFATSAPEAIVTFEDECTVLGQAEALSDGSVLIGFSVGDTGRFVHVGRE